mmetsp:Transcript_24673/g.38307  ORF Transcript_24673/g.38307 Transcript_24673/m.38307 type:complete len:277 (+) Transcript_24673:995-1825(+)
MIVSYDSMKEHRHSHSKIMCRNTLTNLNNKIKYLSIFPTIPIYRFRSSKFLLRFVVVLLLHSSLTQESLLHSSFSSKCSFALLLPFFSLQQFLSSLFSLGSAILLRLIGISKASLLGINLCLDSIILCLFSVVLFICCCLLCRDGTLLLCLSFFGLLLLLFEHLAVLHGLSPDDLTPTRLNLISLGSNLLNLRTNHSLSSLITLPLLHTTHTLRIQLIHPRTLPLYMSHNGNIINTTLHQCLCQSTMMRRRLRPRALSRLPPRLFAFFFDFIIFID